MVFNISGLVVTGYGKGYPAQGLIKTRLAKESCGGGVKIKSEALKIIAIPAVYLLGAQVLLITKPA